MFATRSTIEGASLGRLGLARALAAAVLLAGPLACVTGGTYDSMLQERDALANEKAGLEESMQKLMLSQELLETELFAQQEEVSELRGTYEGLVSDLQSELASGEIQIEQLRDGIRVNVSDDILFPSGSATLNDGGSQILRKVAGQLGRSPHRVEVEGHTDNVPISGGLARRYPTNWELAGARAASVVRLFELAGINGSRMRAVSLSQFNPVAANDSEDGRARNRRIEIRLLPDAGSPVGAAAMAPR